MTTAWRAGARRFLATGVAAGCAAATLLTGLPGAGTVAASAASSPAGNDFSWPQCAKGIGNGQGKPLPSGSRRFEIVGLTNGAGFHENPCLADEWRYASNHASYVTGYTMLTYPTATQKTAAKTGHYGSCTTLACELKNSGWAQGDFAHASLRRIGAHPPMIWVDVEPRPQQPWSSSTSNNSLVVKAAVASLQRHGYRVGIYSNFGLWRQVAGFSTSLPEWVPAGSLSSGCTSPFSGGPVWLSQWAHYYSSGDGYDENGVCSRAPALSSWLQPAHALVTTGRNSDTQNATARYGSANSFGLNLDVVQRPAVVTVRTAVDGAVPLFVGVTPTHRLYARTLATSWRSLGTGYCTRTPGVVARGATAWVGCRDKAARLTLTRVSLDQHGAPGSAATTVYDGSLVGSPALTVQSGAPAATAKFANGTVYSRTPTTDWSACPTGTSTAVPTSTRL